MTTGKGSVSWNLKTFLGQVSPICWLSLEHDTSLDHVLQRVSSTHRLSSIECLSLIPSLNTCRHRHHRHHPPTQTTYQVQFKIEQRWEAKLKVRKKLRLPREHKHKQTNLSQVLRLLRNPARQQHTKAQNTVAQTLSNVTQNHAPSAIHNIRTPIVRATRVAFKPSSCHLRFSNPSGVVRS